MVIQPEDSLRIPKKKIRGDEFHHILSNLLWRYLEDKEKHLLFGKNRQHSTHLIITLRLTWISEIKLV